MQAGGAATSAGIMFQKQLGAFFGACLLSGNRLDERLNLGTARPVWIRFETEAPVDDILIRTSNEGYIAIQAKTTVSLSKSSNSEFWKTISQFVHHWIACRDGDEGYGWNRPLDPTRDRLVLAVSSHSPKTLKYHLPNALRHRTSLGTVALNQAQKRAWDIFESCVTDAWKSSTNDELDPALFDQLAALITVFVFDSEGADRGLVHAQLSASLPDGVDEGNALNALEAVCGEMMSQRRGTDLSELRQAIMTKGINLDPSPHYKQDIIALNQHNQSVIDALTQHEKINIMGAENVSVPRECQGVIESAALEDSLLIVGEPGIGKSGVVNTLSKYLLSQGNDVVALAVDQHSVESLEGLSDDLKLEHNLLEVLENWDGLEPAWLIIDALDATRGGKGEGVFRTLIQRVLEQRGRWRVVASIRTFDLRMGQQFRSLFQGPPPSADFADPSFLDVRHICVPAWSATEFRQLLDAAPKLSDALTNAPQHVWELATIPFNTRLLSELITEDVTVNLSQVSSQADLLDLYWSHRIERHGTPAQFCLRRIVKIMVEKRTLKAPKLTEPPANPEMIDTLSQEGVLRTVENDRYIQFRHHILFDFAAARVLLEPGKIIEGNKRFPKEDALGLMLAPAIRFVLQEIWDSKADRSLFWEAVGQILADQDGDPVIKSAAARLSTEYPVKIADTVWIAGRVAASDANVISALLIISGALAIRIEDSPEIPVEPWVKLLAALAPHVAQVVGTVRFLLFQFIEHHRDASLRSDLGLASRALLEYGYSLEKPGLIVTSAIGFVADTYESSPQESRKLLLKVFAKKRFRKFGWEEVPAICQKIKAIVMTDPDFGAEVYRRTYAFDVTEEQTTNMTSSQILSLTSSARQDYDMARYSLGEFISQFLDKYPAHAVKAIIDAVEGYVARNYPISAELGAHELMVAGRKIILRADHSYTWAWNPNSTHPRDAEVLIIKLLDYLRSCPEQTAVQLANLLIESASLSVIWSRLFIASAERNDAMIDPLLPLALNEKFLVNLDTRKDAIDVLAKGYERLPAKKRENFEHGVFDFDFSEFKYTKEARESFLRTLFSAIGKEALATSEAQELLAKDIEQEEAQNERPFVVRTSTTAIEPYSWLTDLDRKNPANNDVMVEIDLVQKTLSLEANASLPPELKLEEAYSALIGLEKSLLIDGVNPQLRIYGEGVIGQGCRRIVSLNLLPMEPDVHADEIFLRLLSTAATSAGPEVNDDTEGSFEQSTSWGSPAPRVEAAQTSLDLVLQRPDLYPEVSGLIDALLEDSHPAVRMEAGLHLLRIWDIDRDGFWSRLNDRLGKEMNLGVLEYSINGILGRIIHQEPGFVEQALLNLLGRFANDKERQARLHEVASTHLVILWITHESSKARSVIETWISKPTIYHSELAKILTTMRGAFVAGLDSQKQRGDDALRHRALGLIGEIVDEVSIRLAEHYSKDDPNDSEVVEAREMARLLDVACMELYFSVGAGNVREDSSPPEDGIELGKVFAEIAPVLRRIGDCATPHTVYYLLQLLEFLLPFDSECAFDLAAHTLRVGGNRTDYQYDPLGIDVFVRLVGVFLADHKEIFEDDERRAALIDCLKIFMDAGWPAAQRLLYRLPELLQ